MSKEECGGGGAELRADRTLLAFIETLALILPKKWVTEGFEQRSGLL
jgi:hypothetical protein